MKSAARDEVWKWEQGSAPQRESDELACEEPLEIRVGNHPVSVTMRTPGNDEELAAGFLFTEGILSKPADVVKIRRLRPKGPLVPLAGTNPGAVSNVIDVDLRPDVAVDLKRLTRHVFASSSCGLCGKTTIDAVHQQFPPVRSAIRIDPDVLLSLPEKLRAAQETFLRTGGLHAAMIFDWRGEPVVLREDVGRHNAVDKVLGYGLLQDLLPFHEHVLMVSGRASFEIMQKALAGGIPIVAAVSAPSTLAVQFARRSGQTLVGFLRGQRMNIYSLPERVRGVSAG